MKIRCLLVDDEPLAIRLLENHMSKIDSFEVVATCNTAIKALEILQEKEIDLLFLDIKMPNINGVDFLKIHKNPPPTIITTAYREYAIEGYDLDIIDYLLKPITFDRFVRAIERFLRVTNKKATWIAQSKVAATPLIEEMIMIKSGNKHHKVALTNILYIESLKDYVKIHTDAKTIVSKNKISDLEEQLREDMFLRVHRSYIINHTKITAYTLNEIELGVIEIPIGVSYKKKVHDYLGINA